jgi:ketosteroid isomerase-like protein
MSEQNVEVVRRAFESFNRRDVEELVTLSDPDCEWFPFRAQLEGSVYRGHEGVRRFVSDMDDDWTRFEIHPQELHDRGERVLAIGQVEALGRGSGVAVENLGGFVFELRDGRIARLVSHSDPEAARAAVGL